MIKCAALLFYWNYLKITYVFLINKLNFTNEDWLYCKQNILVNIENNQPNEII